MRTHNCVLRLRGCSKKQGQDKKKRGMDQRGYPQASKQVAVHHPDGPKPWTAVVMRAPASWKALHVGVNGDGGDGMAFMWSSTSQAECQICCVI